MSALLGVSLLIAVHTTQIDPLQQINADVIDTVDTVHRWTADDVLVAMSTASPRAQCIVRSEVGGVGYDPFSVGRSGEVGPVQLNPHGLLPDFYAHGWNDPNSPWQSIAYLENALERGMARNWSSVINGHC